MGNVIQMHQWKEDRLKSIRAFKEEIKRNNNAITDDGLRGRLAGGTFNHNPPQGNFGNNEETLELLRANIVPISHPSEVIRKVVSLLEEAHRFDYAAKMGKTVMDRETSVLKSLDRTMRAHTYAKEHGYTIKREEDSDGYPTYSIVPI